MSDSQTQWADEQNHTEILVINIYLCQYCVSELTLIAMFHFRTRLEGLLPASK